MRLFILCLLAAFAAAAPAQAQGPEVTVRWIYESLTGLGPAGSKGLAYLSSPEQRSNYFSRRMVAFYDANDSYGDNLMTACVDFAFDIPGNDFNETEIARTLTVSSTGGAEKKSVTASFSNFGQLAQITYDFIAEDGFWRIDDIAGPGWRVSQIPCKPRGGEAPAADGGQTQAKADAPYTAGAASYCYKQGEDTLRLDVDASGAARFDFISWQANGHTCGAQGQARWTGEGWVYEEALGQGTCRLEMLITSEQGLRLADPDWVCKPSLCGQRAVIDGIVFPRSSQVNCALLPSN